MTTYNPLNLPKNDNLNRFAFVVDVAEEIFLRKGKMIAYYGDLKFESLGSSLLDILIKNTFNAPAYIHNFVVAKGNGQLILGDNGNDIGCYDLDNANMKQNPNRATDRRNFGLNLSAIPSGNRIVLLVVRDAAFLDSLSVAA